MQSNRKVMIAGTSYGSVSWDKHNKEILDSGFIIENSLISKNNEYYRCMTVYLSN
ncbi:hypothetical protein [Clostridium sp.]|uniref:hypothetical protein n=1 Tax=Clostridium sp. TaxID=1506 RepID=UPI003216AE0D